MTPGFDEGPFATEVDRVRTSGALGVSGRLLELFDYLAARGAVAEPATQAGIADAVFGQQDADGDDATVRVYVHRLRKRLDDFYADDAGSGPARLTIPAGTYALRLVADAAGPAQTSRPRLLRPKFAAGALALVLVFIAGWLMHSAFSGPRTNAIWEPFLDSDRPIVVVVGDYYMFGEYNPVDPDQSRLIRDFRVNSPMDLAGLQEAEPDRYGNAEDVGLTYLPFATAYGLRTIMPILAHDGREVTVVAASELHADTIRDANIVYIGLIGALGLLEDTAFSGSGFVVGETYDQLIDSATRRSYTSDEARRLAAPVFYRDYGYVTRFRTPGGSLVAVVAGARETALRGLAQIVAEGELPPELTPLAAGSGFEALFQITGQQGADLSDRIVVARARP